MSHFRHVLFFVTCLFTFLKSICCSPFIEQKQNNKIKGLYDETVVDRMSADLADKLLSLDVYEFSQGPYNYYILDDFGDEMAEYKLIRIPENPQNYIYAGREKLDLEKNFVEIQSFKIKDKTFTKRFYYLENYDYNLISNKAVPINEEDNHDIFNKIIALFQLEFDYTDKLIAKGNTQKINKSLRSYPANFSSVNNQALLDTYLKIKNIHSINTLYSSPGDSDHITMDDPIVTLIPKSAFSVVDTKKIVGEEWGYYLKTTMYDSNLIKADVFLFDICGTYPSNHKFFGMEITPVINEVYFYNSYTDLVYYVQDNNLCFYKPSYAATITYVDEYDWFYNDYDEMEYYVSKQHQPNPGESGYNKFNDLGCFFESRYILLDGKKPVDIAEITHSTFKFFLDSLSVVLNLLNFSYVTSLVANSAILLSNFINDSVFNVYSKYLSTLSMGGDRLNKYKGPTIYSFEDLDEGGRGESDYPENMHKKFSGFSYEEANLLFKDKDHHIRFYNKIAKSSRMTSDYRTLFSQKVKLPLGRDRIDGLFDVDTIDCEVSYLWTPLFQTSDITNQDIGVRNHINLSATGRKFRYEKRLEPGNYKFILDSLPKKSIVNYSHGNGFYTDYDSDAVFLNGKDFSANLDGPIIDSDINDFSISMSTTFYFEIQPSLDNNIVDYSFDCVLLKVDNSILTSGACNSFEILDKTLQCTSNSQMFRFVPGVSALYSIFGSGTNYGCTLSILDSQGRPLIEDKNCYGSFSDMYLLSKDEIYYISYKSYSSNSSIYIKILKNKYIDSYPSQYTSYYCYQKINSSDQCFLFRPAVNVKYKISTTLYSQKIVIYDLNGNILANNRNYESLTFSFIPNQIYLIYVNFLLNDLNFLQGVCLKLEVR